MQIREAVARAIDAQAFVEWQRRYDYEFGESGDAIEAEDFADIYGGAKLEAAFKNADAAIRAVFDHLAANVSEGMLDAGRMHFGNQFIDMIEQAKREYEEAKG